MDSWEDEFRRFTLEEEEKDFSGIFPQFPCCNCKCAILTFTSSLHNECLTVMLLMYQNDACVNLMYAFF